jgi:hypothetical protein
VKGLESCCACACAAGRVARMSVKQSDNIRGVLHVATDGLLNGFKVVSAPLVLPHYCAL